MDKQHQIVSDNLKRLIAKRGLSQRQVAIDIGITPACMNQYCQGTSIPRMGRVQEMADYFGVPVTDIINEFATSTPDENRLLTIFNQLNDDGKALLMSQAEFYLTLYKE